jgi:hypothetical protein
MAQRLERGEIRLYRFTPPDKERPVLILTRASAIREFFERELVFSRDPSLSAPHAAGRRWR